MTFVDNLKKKYNILTYGIDILAILKKCDCNYWQKWSIEDLEKCKNYNVGDNITK